MNNIPQRGTLLSQTRRRLLDHLVEAGLGPGDKLPSKRDFALKYKVSELTVLNAINSLVDAGLLETRPSRGTYVLSPPRRPLLFDAYFPAEWRDVLIANDTAHHSYQLYRQYLDGLALSSSEQDVALTVDYVPQADYAAFASARQTLSRDGAVFYIYGNEELFGKLRERGVPYAHVTDAPARWDNEVGVDHAPAVEAGLDKLQAQGCRSFGMIVCPLDQGRELEYCQMAEEKLRGRGLSPAPEHVFRFGGFVSHEDTAANAERFVAGLKVLPDAFVSGSAYQTRALLRASERLGVDMRGVCFLVMDPRQSLHEPDYQMLFSDPQFFQQSRAAMRALSQGVRNGEGSFAGINIEAVLC